jgi:hypothetical protein
MEAGSWLMNFTNSLVKVIISYYKSSTLLNMGDATVTIMLKLHLFRNT